MSQIARCCLCDQRVRIPDVDATTWVRCPHCHEEYQLQKLAHDLPPRLEVVGERPLIIDSAPGEDPGTQSSPSAAPPAESSSPTVVSSAIVPVLANGLNESPQVDTGEAQARVRSPQTLHANRVKRSTSDGILGFVKVVLGGIGGLALAQVILWWLPQPYQSDPLQLAKQLPAGCNSHCHRIYGVIFRRIYQPKTRMEWRHRTPPP